MERTFNKVSVSNTENEKLLLLSREQVCIQMILQKILGKNSKIILLYFKALSLDLLRFSYLLEDHQESEWHPLCLTWMQTGLFGTLFVPHMKEKICHGSCLWAPTRVPSDAKKRSPALDRLFSPEYQQPWMAEKAHTPMSHHTAFSPILLVLHGLAQKMDDVFISLSCAVWMEWTSRKLSLSSRPKISLSTVSGRYPSEVLTWDCTCMGLVSCQQITQHLAKPPQTWQLALGLEPTQTYLNAT